LLLCVVVVDRRRRSFPVRFMFFICSVFCQCLVGGRFVMGWRWLCRI
jgi:hypothetical protein